MNYKLLSVLVFAFLFSFDAYGQVTVRGTVTDANTGDSLPGVNVFIEQTQQGDATDIDGEFEISDVEPGTYTLMATFVGYNQYETTIEVGSTDVTADIQLTSSITALDDVVVTAFGLDREERSLGYSIQEVNGDRIAQVSQDNIIGALAGKVAGIQVVGSSGANLGGSERIRIRGTNGLSDGQPLFVVDGTPIDNSSFVVNQSGSTTGRDLGNLASDLNLNNVESVSVLKGAAAAALYGNRASDGVILIETKKGQMGENQPIRVNFSNSTYFENVSILPDYQDEYAGGYSQSLVDWEDPETGEMVKGLNYAADESWGAPNGWANVSSLVVMVSS
ncbi:carboxypeptidase-like regulatory domain-containing protein [Rhodohalobacter sp. 614A]|uniref:carboxypeptidase-like regulatory domain-containing protein n=1 Tax=Rhodohalobacter sp. 614A TaxID=2908649 RepID=UPI001F302705|nr:carboxypeptidase-like regulatory domain-containing protein [Rhodohalobacter sp. 614A]